MFRARRVRSRSLLNKQLFCHFGMVLRMCHVGICQTIKADNGIYNVSNFRAFPRCIFTSSNTQKVQNMQVLLLLSKQVFWYYRFCLPKPSGRRLDRQNQITTCAYKEMRLVTTCLFVKSVKPEKNAKYYLDIAIPLLFTKLPSAEQIESKKTWWNSFYFYLSLWITSEFEEKKHHHPQSKNHLLQRTRIT